MTGMTRLVLALALLLLPTVARAQQGPAGKGSYVNGRGQAVSSSFGLAPAFATGFSVDWGVFQNGVVATGTRIAYSNADPQAGQSILFGGGPQFHIALGDKVLLIPAINLATRLSERGGFGFAGYLSLGGAFRVTDTFYAGLEGETPAFVQGAQGLQFFPAVYSANLLCGFYY
jgi:hypothetical protein